MLRILPKVIVGDNCFCQSLISLHNGTVTGNEELTDGMLLSVAMKFSEPMPVHVLAEQGLGMDVHVVKTSLHNNRDINMAMHDVLQKWRVSQPNPQVAYANLYHALEKVGMSNLTGVLNK